MKKLIAYGGDGFGGCKEVAMYSVKHESKKHEKYFNRLSKAREYYDSLNEEKFIWSIDGAPELLDGMIWGEEIDPEDLKELPFLK